MYTRYGYSGFGVANELEDALDDAGIDSFDFELMDDERTEVFAGADDFYF